MNQAIDILFSSWYEAHFDNDKEANLKEYLTVYNSVDAKSLESVFKCIGVEAKSSFQAGFKTAVQLLLESKL
ncbi:MAG: hypothetical protein K2K06_01235 [Oscillospiraceae bacterium]|nr:hypothetical protein [Ruminococcus sp.]MDE6706651.1 hypothetical protein [Oscillospiraceae bacterium]